jgi:hypothetical protein
MNGPSIGGCGRTGARRAAGWLLTASLAAALPAHAAFGGFLGGGGETLYEDCEAPLTAAREVVAPPPADVAGKARAVGNVAGVVGRLGGFGGLGGAIGGASQAAGTAATVAEYSAHIADAAEFARAIRSENPTLDGRFGAYGARMESDADDLALAGRSALEAQRCWETAYDELAAGVEAGEIGRRERGRRHDEITDGVERTSELLIDARNRMNTNIRAFNDSLETETREAGVDVGGLLGLAASTGLAEQALGAVGRPDAGCGDVFDANCARRRAALRARAAGGWGGLHTDADPAGSAAPSYGVAEELAVQGALATGNAAGALGIMGAASAAPSVASSYRVLTSDGREAPECAGLDDGAALYACLEGAPAEAVDGAAAGGFVMNDLATLGLVRAVPGSAGAIAGAVSAHAQAGAFGAVDEAAVEQLVYAGEVSGRYLEVNRGLNAADRAQAALVEKTEVRPW